MSVTTNRDELVSLLSRVLVDWIRSGGTISVFGHADTRSVQFALRYEPQLAPSPDQDRAACAFYGAMRDAVRSHHVQAALDGVLEPSLRDALRKRLSEFHDICNFVSRNDDGSGGA